MKALTEKQQAVLDYIRLYLGSHGVCPTSREIQSRFRFKSQTAAAHHLNRLEKKGHIQRTGHRYGLTGPLVLWDDVKPLVKVLDFFQQDCYAKQVFFERYPHLKP